MTDTINDPIAAVAQSFDVREMDFTETLDECQELIAEQHGEMFSNEHDSNNSPWAPLKPSTIAHKGHDRILFETGALEASLVHVGGPGNISETATHGLVFGTEVEYAIFHQTGTSRMPARPPVGLSDETIDKIVEKVADATIEKLLAGD